MTFIINHFILMRVLTILLTANHMTKTHCKEYKWRKMLGNILRKMSILRKDYQICFIIEYMYNILVDVVTLNSSLQLKLVHCTVTGDTSSCAEH